MVSPPPLRTSGLSPMHSFVVALVVTLAAVLAVAGAYVVVAGVPPLPGESRAQSVDAETPPPPTPGLARVVVVGDEFTLDGSWPALMCAQAGCEAVTQLSAPGSGWTVPGGDGMTLADRLDAVLAARPDVVVLAAGAADTPTALDRFSGTVNEVLYRLGRKLPATRVVVLSPFSVSVPAPTDLADVRSRLHDAADKHGNGYVGVTGLPADGDAGHQQQVADLVAPAVRAALGS